MNVCEYHRALELIVSSPLSLSEYDFSVLEAFNPADERRGRDAVRQAQLAIVATHTKAIDPPAPRTRPLSTATLAAGVLQIATKIGEIGRRLDALEGKTATVAELRRELVDVRAKLQTIENPGPAPQIEMRPVSAALTDLPVQIWNR